MAPAMSYVHIVYLAFVLAILVFMYKRKDTVLLTLIAIFTVGVLTTNSLIGGIQGVFNSVYNAAVGMFIIPVLIAVIYSLSKIMKETGADYVMVSPLKSLLGKPTLNYWILGVIMFVLSLFFWPTPAAGLVGAILVPVAVKAGMSPLSAAVPIALFGHGGALSGDWVLQGAPTILAKASGISVADILSTSTLIVGAALITSSLVAFLMNYKEMRQSTACTAAATATAESAPTLTNYAKLTAVIVPAVLLFDIFIMVTRKLIGGDATALLGGSVFLLLIIICIMEYKAEALPKLTNHLKSGFIFAMEIFTPVFVIAAFFLIGSPEGAVSVFGKGAPGYLIDIGQYVAGFGAVNKVALAIVQVIVASLTGLDGAGFAQLPLVGSLARSLAPAIGANPAPLAVLGQMATIWTAGALAPWGFLAAMAAFCGVDPVEVARRNFIPTMCGFAAATVVAILLM